MTLPLLISVPHAGIRVPPDVEGLCRLTEREIIEDGDEGAAEVYDLRDHVQRFVTTDVARAIVDLNRAEDDRRRDGVVKTHTCWDVPVYRSPPTDELVEQLLATHYRPYHSELSRPGDDVILGVDCHTMAATAPPVAPDPGSVRPLMCLGDGDGALPEHWFDALCHCFEEAFGADVGRNEPFRGGYVTRHHASERPWMQLELSRAPFLTCAEKRARVLQALERFCAAVLGGDV